MSALPKWTEELTARLETFVGDEAPVSRATVEEAAEQLGTTPRSVGSKLRKLGYEVEKASEGHAKAFSETQEATLRNFVTQNSGKFTYGEIAEAFAGGEFNAKQIQGKILSMELTEHVKPTPKPETVRTYTEAEEATFVSMAGGGAFLEEIAEKLGKEVNSVRGKALSLFRQGQIEKIPAQRDKKGDSQVDPLEALGDISGLTVVQISEKIGKTPRGVKTMLTRRGLVAADYNGAAKKEKAAE
jgi:hypothetical protein